MGNLYTGGELRHSPNLISYAKKDNPQKYYTTITDNELIDFSIYGEHIHSNFLRLEAVDNSFYVAINDGDYLIYIPSGRYEEISYMDITSVRIIAPVGAKLRWYIQMW